jgi:dGTPase
VREGVALFRGFHNAVLAEYPAAPERLGAYEALKRLLNALVSDLLEEARRQTVALGAETLEEVRRAPHRLAALSPEMEAARTAAKEFLHASLYNSPVMEEAHAHAVEVVRGLFAALMSNPGLMPGDDQAQIPSEGLARTVADYIAGMTDSYIEQVWTKCGGRSDRVNLSDERIPIH